MTSSIVLEAKNLRLVFHNPLRKLSSLRDLFIASLTRPSDVFFPPIEPLEILNGVSFQLRRDDKVGLIGVNGAGKTSLCRILAGIYHPTSGVVSCHGQVRAIFNTMSAIYPELTGRENAGILLDLMYPKLSRIERGEKLKEALAFSELGHFLDVPFKFYSNGMQARLSLSLLTVGGTDLLILDEVFEGADQFFSKKISERITRVIQSSGAVVFVSHDESQIRRVCNRLIVLKRGCVGFDGSVEEGLRFYRESEGASLDL